MQINVRLFGSLRHRVPRENRGKTTVDIAPNALVQDVLDIYDIDEYVIVAVNDEQESDNQSPLQSGDTVMIFEASAGG